MRNCYTYMLMVVLLLAYCSPKHKATSSPSGYDLEKREKFLMPESLQEISGICFENGNPDTIYSLQDEEGKVFRMAWGVKKQVHTKFSRSGDYEDLTILRGKLFVLKSRGDLYAFPVADAAYKELDSVQEWKDILPKAEYESMYGDEQSGNLYVLCKHCPDDADNDILTGYMMHVDDSAMQPQPFVVDVKSLRGKKGKVKKGFKPSALAKNPITNEWFILSAVNQLLVVADSNWKILNNYYLNSNYFNQPEGLAFDRDGNMYISNEGDDITTGNILKFARKEIPKR
jgi:hypothetical protein